MTELENPYSVVVGIGNPMRGDDIAGLLTVREIRKKLAKPAQSLMDEPGSQPLALVESNGEFSSLMELLRSHSAVYLIDALCVEGKTPGEVMFFDVLASGLPSKETLSSSHSFGLAQAIEMNKILGALPKKLFLFGIVGRNFGLGAKPSPAIKRASFQVANKILKEIGWKKQRKTVNGQPSSSNKVVNTSDLPG